ncbi:MAG TPA: O-antigen ligase family protein [Solirubrobacterales bacterium]|nr:O-antigen ligase family protein [Solirubrobacterales bacterium]
MAIGPRARDDAPESLRIQAQRALAFLASVTLVAYLALRGGGYDLVVRQEVGLILWWSIAVAFTLGLLPAWRLDRPRWWALAALAALVGWTAFSLLWTQSDESSFAELARTLDYAGLIVLAWSAIGRDTWRAAAAGLSVGVVSIAVVAIVSRLFPSDFPTTAVERFFGPQRLSRPLDYWNALGCWCAMSIALALGWSAGLRDRLLRAASLATVPLAGAALYLTYSRGAVFAGAAGVAAVIALSPNRRTAAVHAALGVAATGLVVAVIRTQPAIADGRSGHGGIVVALALLGVCLACGVAAAWTEAKGLDGSPASIRWLRPGPIAVAALATIAIAAVGTGVVSGAGQVSSVSQSPSRTGDPAARLTSLGGARSDIWASAWRAFESKPLTGIGPGTFGLWWARDSDSATVFKDAHSLYLETLAELGVPGELALVATLGALLAAALRALTRVWRESHAWVVAGLVAAYFAFLVQAGVDWMWESTAVAAVAVGSVAIAAAASAERRQPRPALRWGRVAVVGIAVIAGAIQIPGIVSTDRVRASADALASGFDEDAARLASQAVSSEPWAADPYATRAFVELKSGELGRARIDVGRAIAREPTNWEHRQLLARIDIQAGDTRAAQRALTQMRALRPALAPEVRATKRALRSRSGDPRRLDRPSG